MRPEQLLPHLPSLRRYARLVTGAQASGDALVEVMLERLLASGDRWAPAGNPRMALYKSLAHVIAENRRELVMEPANGHANGNGVEARLGAIKPVARDVFLLVTVEEFSLLEAAEILDMTPADVGRHLEFAGSEIARQMATTVLIIEDEPLIAMTLEAIVESMGHTVTGIASTKSEALTLLHARRPGLILADIQLADGSSGMEAVFENSVSGNGAPAIFITAFPERVLTGRKPEPTFVITKPFEADQVKAIVSQTLFFRR